MIVDRNRFGDSVLSLSRHGRGQRSCTVPDFNGSAADDWIPDDYHGIAGRYSCSESKDFGRCAVSCAKDGL